MELEDCSFPALAGVDATSNHRAGMDGASWVLCLGAPRRTAGMERADLLTQTVSSFTTQGAAVAHAAADVRVIVVGNPANTNCLIARHAAPDVPDDRWFAMLRLDHNRTRSQLADHVGVALSTVRGVTVWGNHSATMVPDVWHAAIDGRPATDVVDEAWITDELMPTVQQRGATLIAVSGASSAASAATALADDITTFLTGTAAHDWTTMGIVSQGEYGIPNGLVSGMPVTMSDGVHEVVDGLAISDTQRRLIQATVNELTAERDLALSLQTDSR